MNVPPNTMESESATTLVQDSTAIFADDGLGRGVVIGVMDMGEEGALVSLLGPADRLLVARRVVELVSKGVRTLLERWDWEPSSG